MAEIINLRLARKTRKRIEAARTAAENRARFGQSRMEREQVRIETARAMRSVDGARLQPITEDRTED